MRSLLSRSGTERSTALLLGCTLASCLICASLLVYGSGRGFDLTDEVFYLIWARDPHAYALMYQPFGFLLHPLFVAVGGNLQAYRLAGFATAAAAGAFLGAAVPCAGRQRTASILFGAASALTMFFPWIITPSYNSAANVGALLIIGGILNASRESRSRQAIVAIAAGAGLCIAAFAKPPLFALAVLGTLTVALLARRARTRVALLAVLMLGALFISLFLPLSGVPGVLARMLVTQHVLALPNTPLALPGKILRDWLGVPLVLSGGMLAALISLFFARSKLSKWPGYTAICFALVYLLGVVPDAVDGAIPDFIGLALAVAAAGYAGIVRPDHAGDRATVLVLLGAPMAVALGTFNNQWFQLNFSLPFPLLALFTLALADRSRRRAALAFGFAVAAPVAVLLLAAWAPYSLPASIFAQQVPVRPPIVSGSTLVDQETADFIEAGRGVARGALLVDLSGTGPGVAAVLDATAPVLPWLNPATPAWADVAWRGLSTSQRDQAWFVVPVWPLFQHSAPAIWLQAHRSRYCRTALPEMPFWGEERTLEIWRPCRGTSLAAAH